jgi:hypothetical protein
MLTVPHLSLLPKNSRSVTDKIRRLDEQGDSIAATAVCLQSGNLFSCWCICRLKGQIKEWAKL